MMMFLVIVLIGVAAAVREVYRETKFHVLRAERLLDAAKTKQLVESAEALELKLKLMRPWSESVEIPSSDCTRGHSGMVECVGGCKPHRLHCPPAPTSLCKRSRPVKMPLAGPGVPRKG